MRSTAGTASYEEVLKRALRLQPEEQLALVAEIAKTLRDSAYLRDEVAEVAYLAESPTFHRLVDRGLEQVREGKVRKAETLLDEL